MKIKIKFVLLLGAFLITLLAFNLIATSSAGDLLKRGHNPDVFSEARILSQSQASLHYSLTVTG